jgi:hypothetical protein
MMHGRSFLRKQQEALRKTEKKWTEYTERAEWIVYGKVVTLKTTPSGSGQVKVSVSEIQSSWGSSSSLCLAVKKGKRLFKA